MKRFQIFLGLAIIVSFLSSVPYSSQAQDKKVRPSLKASTGQTLGVDTEITIVYSRPGVKGRKIWGELVPYGLAPGNKYSKEKPYPWRAGANENTTIEFTKDVMVEGQNLPAGKYGIHMIPSEGKWTIIFSKNNSLWGSYAYNQDEDALRISVTPVAAPHKEWLTFGFKDLAGTEATAYLHWENYSFLLKLKQLANKAIIVF